MISPKRSSRPRLHNLRQIKMGVVLFCTLFVFVVLVLFREQGSALLWRVWAPVARYRESLGMSDVTLLRAELASTTAALADRDALRTENLELKSRLGREASVRSVLAGVLMRPPATPYDTLLLDAGSDDGIVEGDMVAAAGTTLIGTVTSVAAHSARVTLFSAPGETFQGTLLTGGHSMPVSLDGQGDSSFVAQVPAGTSVAVGDSVVFPGVAGGYVGSVSAVVSRSGESFETLYLHLPVNAFDLRFVDVWQQSHATQ